MSDFKAKMHQIQFWLGSAPDPAEGTYSTPPVVPDPLAGFRGPTSEGGEEGRREEGREMGRSGEREEQAWDTPWLLPDMKS